MSVRIAEQVRRIMPEERRSGVIGTMAQIIVNFCDGAPVTESELTWMQEVLGKCNFTQYYDGGNVRFKAPDGDPITGSLYTVLEWYASRGEENVSVRGLKLRGAGHRLEKVIVADLQRIGIGLNVLGELAFNVLLAYDCMKVSILTVEQRNLLLRANWKFAVRDGQTFFYSSHDLELLSDPIIFVLTELLERKVWA